MNTDLSTLSPAVLVVLGVVVVLQFALIATCLVVLARTPRERLLLGRKWPWAIFVVVFSFVGSIFFLVAARQTAPATEQPSGTGAGDVGRTVQSLYGQDRR